MAEIQRWGQLSQLNWSINAKGTPDPAENHSDPYCKTTKEYKLTIQISEKVEIEETHTTRNQFNDEDIERREKEKELKNEF